MTNWAVAAAAVMVTIIMIVIMMADNILLSRRVSTLSESVVGEERIDCPQQGKNGAGEQGLLYFN